MNEVVNHFGKHTESEINVGGLLAGIIMGLASAGLLGALSGLFAAG